MRRSGNSVPALCIIQGVANRGARISKIADGWWCSGVGARVARGWAACVYLRFPYTTIWMVIICRVAITCPGPASISSPAPYTTDTRVTVVACVVGCCVRRAHTTGRVTESCVRATGTELCRTMIRVGGCCQFSTGGPNGSLNDTVIIGTHSWANAAGQVTVSCVRAIGTELCGAIVLTGACCQLTTGGPSGAGNCIIIIQTLW